MNVFVNGDDYRCSDEGRLDGLLRELEIADRRIAVVVNAQVVPADAIARHRLHEHDRIDILTLAGGG